MSDKVDLIDKILSLVLLVGGILVVVICMTADLTGIGAEPMYIGWKQYSGAAIGVMMILLGAHIAYHHVIRKEA